MKHLFFLLLLLPLINSCGEGADGPIAVTYLITAFPCGVEGVPDGMEFTVLEGNSFERSENTTTCTQEIRTVIDSGGLAFAAATTFAAGEIAQIQIQILVDGEPAGEAMVQGEAGEPATDDDPGSPPTRPSASVQAVVSENRPAPEAVQ